MNIFSVLDTSDAEEEVVQKVNKKKESTNEKQTTSKPAATNKPQSAKPRDAKNEEVKASTGISEDTREKKDDNRGGRPRGKEGVRRGDKHHGATEGEKPRRPKREFERRSGTGRGKEVSRGGRGPYGFGNVEQEAHDAEKDPSKAEVAVVENADDVAEPEGESTPVPEVEEAPTLSFDDFMRMREESRNNSSVLAAARAPRQVNLDAQFAGLTTKEDKDLEQGDQKASKASNTKKDQRSTNKTQLLDVQFKFEANNNYQRQGGRRERDNFTNKGGRFGGRGTRKPRDTPAPLNSGDFPSL